jgi:hypothetical protein
MRVPERTTRLEIKIRSPWEKSSAWARVITDGSLELELYDFSLQAASSMGGDLAWIWTVQASDMPQVLSHLPAMASESDRGLLTVLAGSFTDVHAIRDWIREKEIPLREDFDSQA